MWARDKSFQPAGFSTPPPTWKSGPANPPPRVPMSERKRISPAARCDLFHVAHKVPAGDSPYVRAKQVQLIDKNPSKAISLFWAAINAGDRVDSALKDIAVVMKRLGRAEEAIEGIRSFGHLCPFEFQESLNNVLVELYKRTGGIEDEIEMLQSKLKRMDEGIAFNGKRTKNARAQGKKVQNTVEQERSRVLGNLAWAYMQQGNYTAAKKHYENALALEPDKNKQCNLAVCLMHMNRNTEARLLLQPVRASSGNKPMDESYAKSFKCAFEMLTGLETQSILRPIQQNENYCTAISRTPMSPINRNLNQVSSLTDGGQHYVSGYTPMPPRRWTDGPENVTVIANERHRESFRPGSSAESSDKWRKDYDLRNTGDNRPSFSSKMKENQGGMIGTEAKGTTTIAVIGETAIFLATDRRLTHLEHYHILGTGRKIFTVQARGQPVLATIAGNFLVCKKMLNYVKRKLRIGITRDIHSSRKGIHMAAFHGMKYVGAWELKHGKIFPAKSVLAGWDGKQPWIYTITSVKKGGLEYKEGGNSIVVTGSGGRFALAHAKRKLRVCKSNEFGRVARESVLNAAMQDAATGEQIQLVEILQNGYIGRNPQDVLHILDEMYVAFQRKLVNSLFFVHSRDRLPYTHASAKILSDEIVARLGVSLAQMPHVVALKARYVVWIVILNKCAHKAFKALRDGNEEEHRHLVPPFSNWPWLYFDRLPFVPISFARATKDMITVLVNL